MFILLVRCVNNSFETEVANAQDRQVLYRKLVMINSPLFIHFINSND